MINENLPENIHHSFFTLLTDIPHNRYNTFLPALTERLKKVYSLMFASIYVYNEWMSAYERFDNEERLPLHFHSPYVDEKTFQVKWNDRNHNIRLKFIPIEPEKGPDGFLVISDNEQNSLPESCEHTLQEMLIGVCNYLNVYEQNLRDKEKSDFLFNCASRFYTINRKSKILKEIIRSLQKLYPDCSYFLLLSQDNEADKTLPIKMMAYSDDATKRASKQAFLSGEVQIENRLQGKNICVYAPLRGKQGIYGVLQIITPDSMTRFPETELDFITKFADTAGQAIENVSLYQYAKHLANDLKLINETTHQLNLNLKLSEITKLVSKQMIHTCKAKEIGFIYFNDKKSSFDILTGSTSFFYTEGGKAFSAYLRMEMENQDEPILQGDYLEQDKTFPYRSIMIIPMIQSGIIYGVITLLHEKSYFFSFEQFKLMESLVQHSTLALSNAMLKGELEKTIITDYLTKLYSRNHLDDTISLHMQEGAKGAFILFDIDDFKQINDLYGHTIGDKVIVQAAGIIKNNIRSTDVAARWGGEELAVYLPEATLQEGVDLANDISHQVSKNTDPVITFSSGVSSWTIEKSDSVGELFARADKALYDAKGSGKNRVVLEQDIM